MSEMLINSDKMTSKLRESIMLLQNIDKWSTTPDSTMILNHIYWLQQVNQNVAEVTQYLLAAHSKLQ